MTTLCCRGRIRTFGNRIQSAAPYHLATRQRGNTLQTVSPDFSLTESGEPTFSQVLSKTSVSSAISKTLANSRVIVSRVRRTPERQVSQAGTTDGSSR